MRAQAILDPAMPPARCMYFDESGAERNGGCYLGDRCNFIHPRNPAWATAQPSRNAPRGRGMGRGGFGESRGRGRGRGSGPVNPSSSSSGFGWDTGGGSDNNAQSSSSSSGWAITTTSAKDSGQQANISTATLWDTGDPWGTSSAAKEPAATSGWGDSDTWGGNSGTGGGWDNAPSGDKSFSTRNTTGTSDMAKPDRSTAIESSAGRRGDAIGSGWGNPSNDDKFTGGWDAPGTSEMTSRAEPKRNDADQENYRYKASPVPPPPRPPRRASRAQDDEEDTRPLKITGTNDVPMVNTRWNRKEDSAVPPHLESSERPRVPPLQTSALNNATPKEPPTPISANRYEDDRMDVENWRLDTIPGKDRDRSPSLSIVTGSTVKRKRKRGYSDLERKQDIWKDFIRICDRAVRAKVDLAKAEAERQNWRRAQKSANYTRIGEAGRIRLDEHRAELEKVCAGHSDKLSQAISELAEIGDKLKSGIDYDERYDIGSEVTRYSDEVGAWLSDIRPLLIAHTTKQPPDTNHPTPREDELSEEPLAVPDGLGSLQSHLDKQEELLEELRTALTLESSNDPLATIDDTIDKKIDVLRKDRAAQRAKRPPPGVVIPPEATGAIEDVSRKAEELSAAMKARVEEVAKLQDRQNDQQKMQASFKSENEELIKSIAKLTETSAANRKLIQEQTEDIQRLKASLEAASELQRIPPPPAEPPATVILNDLRAAVNDVLQDVVSREVVPMINGLRNECSSENNRFHSEVFEIIWDHLKPSFKIAEAVHRWSQTLELPAS